ncbi:MAG: exosortase N [Bacteroidota bacterium]|nr:exosortase N [Bacteroidota bacterium]
MVNSINPSFYIKTLKVQVAVLIASYLFIWNMVLSGYLSFTSLPFLLGALALPFTVAKSGNKISYRYALIALVCVVISFFIPVKTFLFFSISFSIFFLIESVGYRLGYVSCSVLFFMSPIFQYLSNVFSFPIRLQLTKWSGKLFSFVDPSTAIKGNIIYHNNNEFSVDPACMGLNMLTASLLLSIILLGFYQKKLNTNAGLLKFSGFLILVISFNIISNLIRIVVLVHFTILPGTLMHEVIGIACLFLYVVLPSAFLANLFASKSAISKASDKTLPVREIHKPLLHGLLLMITLFSAYHTNQTDTYKQFSNKAEKMILGFKTITHSPGIVKLENDKALIYVKYIRGFYDTEHNPTICWKGSGYEFRDIKEETVSNFKVYTALLVNGRETLTTAWWYSNGNKHLTHQFAWRWSMMKGEKNYALINVTTATIMDRERVITKIISERLFAPLF